MWWRFLSCIIFSVSLFSNPVGLETIQGSASIHKQADHLRISASNGAVLHWEDFSIGMQESTEFLQPSETSWVLNQVKGNSPSEILGHLSANGQVILLNSHGILFGNGSTIDVGGIIASTLGEGSIINKGRIHARSGDVILLGKEVINSGNIKISGKSLSKGEENPYDLAIHYTRPKQASILKEVNGRILLISEEKTVIPQSGTLQGKEIGLLSNGKTIFEGFAAVDDGMIEISGRGGFKHDGIIKRSGGLLILDPEADIKINQTVPYNYSFEKGGPTADISNISVDLLVKEIERGPVMITTAYQGDGGGNGSIHIEKDVSYNSPYPLIFNCSGNGGIHVAGKLKNMGNGDIGLRSKEITLSGELEGATINAEGRLTCSGHLYGDTVNIRSENGALVTGRVVAKEGPLKWIGGETLSLKGGEIGTEGNGLLKIQGFETISLEETSRLFTFASDLSITDLNGTLSAENASILSGGSLDISGDKGDLYMQHGKIQSNKALNIDLGGYLHLDDSTFISNQPIALSIGNNLTLTGQTLLTSTKGISLKNKGSLFMQDQAKIEGKGLCLIVGESTELQGSSQIEETSEKFSFSSGENLLITDSGSITAAKQMSIHVGDTISLENYGNITSSQGAISMTAGKNLALFGNGSITAHKGGLNLCVTQGNLTLYGNSSLKSETGGSLLTIGNSLIMNNFSSITSTGENGLKIVVDHLDVGGGIQKDEQSSIITGSAPLLIYSASRKNNSIKGALNDQPYNSQMPLYLNTHQEQWGALDSTPLFAAPFTVFYKDDGLIQTTIGPLNRQAFNNHLLNYIGPFTAELFRNLHPYDAYIKESITFTDNKEPYFIRRRSKK